MYTYRYMLLNLPVCILAQLEMEKTLLRAIAGFSSQNGDLSKAEAPAILLSGGRRNLLHPFDDGGGGEARGKSPSLGEGATDDH